MCKVFETVGRICCYVSEPDRQLAMFAMFAMIATGERTNLCWQELINSSAQYIAEL